MLRTSNKCSQPRASARCKCGWKKSSHSGTSSRAIIAHWFNPGGEKRHTYAHHLTQHLDEGELRQVRQLFEQSLANHAVTWTTSQVFVVAGRQ